MSPVLSSRRSRTDKNDSSRYTDFLVNEILLSGQVVHLDELKPPRKQQPASRAPEIMPLPSSSTGHAREPPAEVLQQSGSGPQASEEAKTHASNQKEPTAAQLNGVDASSVKQPNEFKVNDVHGRSDWSR